MGKPLCIDLFCGLGGWTEGFLAEGYDVVGFDIERHVYGEQRYPAQLVLQDILTVHGSQFRNAACIVCSPPCQEFSYMAMPWTRAKKIAAEYRSGVRDVADLTRLFDACFRIQREANEAVRNHCVTCGVHLLSHHAWTMRGACERFAGGTRYIPMVVENVKGAQPWVGPARWHYGSFYLWGDVPALMPFTSSMKMGRAPKAPNGVTRRLTNPAEWRPEDVREYGQKNNGGSWFNIGSPGQTETGRNPVNGDGTKQGGNWWHDPDSITRRTSSRSHARKAASAQIAKIPFDLARFDLARYIASVFKPHPADLKPVASFYPVPEERAS